MANHISTKLSATTFLSLSKNVSWGATGGNIALRQTWIACKFKKVLFNRGR